MSYVYIVTRIFDHSMPGITQIPNLGVHTSLKKAQKHFDSVYQDRTQYGPVTMTSYDDTPMNSDRSKKIQWAFTNDGEEIRLEKWKVK